MHHISGQSSRERRDAALSDWHFPLRHSHGWQDCLLFISDTGKPHSFIDSRLLIALLVTLPPRKPTPSLNKELSGIVRVHPYLICLQIPASSVNSVMDTGEVIKWYLNKLSPQFHSKWKFSLSFLKLFFKRKSKEQTGKRLKTNHHHHQGEKFTVNFNKPH